MLTRRAFIARASAALAGALAVVADVPWGGSERWGDSGLRITAELLNDSAFNLDTYLTKACGQEFARAYDAMWIDGG